MHFAARAQQRRIDWAIYQYQTQSISLAKAAALASVSNERFKEILVQRGIPPFKVLEP